MRLHEMNAEQLRDTLCALAGPLSRIAEDPQTQQVLDALTRQTEEMTAGRVWRWLVCNAMPLVLQRHPEDGWAVAAALTGREAAQVRAMNGMALLAELQACWDEEIGGFFSCAGCTEQATS